MLIVKFRLMLSVSSLIVKKEYCICDFIEQFMAEQAERGFHVISHRFVGSGHVNHFRLYPLEYGKLVLDFIVNIEKDK